MKQYVKPDLFYEDFGLNQHIANCTFQIASTDSNSCGCNVGAGLIIYNDIPNICNAQLSDGQIYCEYAPQAGMNTFSS